MPKNKRYGDLRDLGRVHPFKFAKPKKSKPTVKERMKTDVENVKKGIKRQTGLAKRDFTKLLKKMFK